MAGESLIIGNGNWGVKSGNLLGYNLNNAKYVPRELTFTRATTGTRTNGALLVEDTPPNLFQYSEQFDNALWGKASTTIVTPNTTTAPNGTMTADSFILNGAGSCFVFQTPVVSFNFFTTSIYVKYVNRQFIQIVYGSGLTEYANFDILNGLVTGGSYTGASISNEGNGWFRISLTSTGVVASLDTYIWAIDSGTALRAAACNGIGSYSIWGAQIVNGSSTKPYFGTTTRLNFPRIDYSTGTAALLMEPQRTNVNLKSNDFTLGGGNWYNFTAGSPVANQGISPDGTNNAWTLLLNSTLTTEFGKSIGLAIGDKTSASIYAKGSETAFNLYIQNTINTDVLGTVIVNLTTGVITSGSGTVQSMGNGWYRITTVGTSTIVNGYPRSAFKNPNSACLIYGSQYEAGSSATSYIPTTSASVTRNIDTLIQSGISNFIGQTQGTIFFDVRIGESDSSSTIRLLGGISDGTSGNRIEIYRFNNTIQTDGTAGGVFQFGANVFAITNFNTNLKIAISYSLNNVNTFVNGVLVSTDTTALIPACSRLTVGCDRNGSSSYGGLINQMSLFPTPLSNAELAILTTK